LGCGAHSTRNGVREKNLSSTTEYIARVADRGQLAVERRELTDQERVEEALFTGLRLSCGLDLNVVKSRYGVDVRAEYGSDLEPFVQGGLLIYDGARMRLTRAGMLLAHEVMTVFINSSVR
jgi:oxygen-independent coproporphyrinogen-3 oxidase